MAALTAFAFLLAQLQAAAADIVNDAIATANYGAGTVTSTVSSQAVPVISAIPAVSVVKSGNLNDDDGTPGLSAGDTIAYSVTVANTGNVSLTGVSISDPLIALTFDAGDSDADGEIDPGETWTYSGSYSITQVDIDTNGGGDGDFDNSVTFSSAELPDEIANNAVALPVSRLNIAKIGTLNDDDGIPGISAGDTVDYEISISNTGTSDQTGVSVSDQLVQGTNNQSLTLNGPVGDTGNDGVLGAGETWTYTTIHTLSQSELDDGNDLVNTATVTTDQTASRSASHTVLLTGLQSVFTMSKTAALSDLDGNNLGDAGETITYTFAFANIGNMTLTDIRPIDTLTDLSVIACLGDADNDGDIDALAPGATATCSATYLIKQADVDAGFLTNTASAMASAADGISPVVEDDAANDNSATVAMNAVTSLHIEKVAGTPVQIFSTVYDYDYTISVTNTGTTLQTNLRLQDNLIAAIDAPATLVGTPVLSVSNFAGSGDANPGFDGITDVELLVGDVQLAPGDSGTVTLSVRIDTGGKKFTSKNVVFGESSESPSPAPSDDPTETPDDPDDTNPTPAAIEDADEDGAPDTKESYVQDRDGDGVTDAQDYDPTGYFYCEDDGRILSGGSITVLNLTGGGSQTGVGTSNNITIVQDGSSGFYQFHVDAPGTYRLVPNLPPGTVASTTRASLGLIDVTSLLPADPGVLGAGEVGSTGILNDFSASANPFYTDFEIEAGDPNVFNNNLPVGLCGIPEVSARKTLVSGPTVLADGRSQIQFRIEAENIGDQTIDNVALSDDLATVFGSGNYVINSVALETAPAGFSGAVDPFFDGDGTQSLVTSGGSLQSGERLSILIDLTADVADGNYTNVAVASGDDVRDSSPLPVSTSSVSFDINSLTNVDGLVVQKTTPVASARLGTTVPFSITYSNGSTRDISGVDFVDFMPGGFTYVTGSARLDNVPVEPQVSGRELVWPGQTLTAGGRSTLTLSLTLGANATGTEFVNSSFMRNPLDGAVISSVGRAVIKLEIDPVLQCSDIVGRVYDDQNGDGYYDDGEPGLAGVRIATVNGLLITTDQFGRYHVACDQIPDDRIGSNYILKLDTRTLPTGYRVTSENPRVVRVTRGKLAKINFGAVGKRTVRLEISDQSFAAESTDLTRAALADIARALPLLEKEPSVLELVYRSGGQRTLLQRARLRSVRSLIEKAWDARDRSFDLEIDSKVQ